MPLLDSVGGLFRAVNSKADSILGAAKGLLCLPAIIAGAGDIFKDVLFGRDQLTAENKVQTLGHF